MANTDDAKCARVLDPVERVTEVIFGLLMAMTFTGTISVATGGQEEERTMMIAALGCNLAWGLADAVMYLLRSLVEHSRKRTLLASLRGGSDPAAGRALIAQALPWRLVAAAGTEELEALRQRLIRHAATAVQPRLGWDDFKGAVGVFLLVVLSTFPPRGAVPAARSDGAGGSSVQPDRIAGAVHCRLGAGQVCRWQTLARRVDHGHHRCCADRRDYRPRRLSAARRAWVPA